MTLFLGSLGSAFGGDQPSNSLSLWYKQPAKVWMTEALPIGNGRVGAMIFGGVEKDHIQFNESSLWSGSNKIDQINGLAEAMPMIQKLAAEGKISEANKVCDDVKMPKNRRHFGAYQAFGDFYLTFSGHEDQVQGYRRSLDIANAVGRVSYELADVVYQRDYFASFPDQVIVVRLTANKPGSLTFRIDKTSPHKQATVNVEDNRDLVIHGVMQESGQEFSSRLRVLTKGGSVSSKAKGIEVNEADSVLLILACKTDYAMNWPNQKANIDVQAVVSSQIEAASAKTYKQLFDSHKDDYCSLFDRVSLNLSSKVDRSELPTNQRLTAYHESVKVKEPSNDLGLETLLFNYGRYLLIASSRMGSLPANLQGIWNNSLSPMWDSDYHTDINLQMNYWLSGPTALPECFEPFSSYSNFLRKSGADAARKYFNADGFFVNIYSNPWGYATPRWVWPGAGGWLAQSLYDHYLYTGDINYLKQEAYPYMKDSCAFLLDILFTYKDGSLVIAPSVSPETFIKYTDGNRYRISAGAAIDQQIAYDLFTNTIEAAGRLNVDKDLVKKLKDILPRLSAPVRIRKNGLIQEWVEDWPSSMPTHRHASHLYALYPGCLISPEGNPGWAKAAAKTIVQRSHEKTEWVTAWHMLFWSRLLNAEKAHEQFSYILVPRKSTKVVYRGGSGVYDNLLTTHPPFCIDGNLGTTAGMAEMLLQSHLMDSENNRIIHLLPALPSAWEDGSVTGLRARGQFVIDIEWKGGKLVEANLISKSGTACKVKYLDQHVNIPSGKGRVFVLKLHKGQLRLGSGK